MSPAAEREYLDQVRRSVLQIVAAFLRLTPSATLTLDVRIVERKPADIKIASPE